ncbi:MAG: mrp [Cyanobacteria bacterium RYN_339]|nr:mrp [Cyanobacteria bacterium RYN_339]
MALEDLVLDALKQVMVPDVQRDVVALGLIKEVKAQHGIVTFSVELTPASAGLQARLDPQIKQAVKAVPGVNDLAVHYLIKPEAPAKPKGPSNPPGIKHIIAVGSGKGGVGKSTVTANLAIALSASGLKVGILDADIYGPSIPLMLGAQDQKPGVLNEKLLPIEAHGLKLMSMGFLLPNADDPVVWRGPMLAGALRQFLNDVNWGELDVLLVDLPPGTGDIPLTLVQLIPLSGAVIVITPQPVAAAIGTKTLRMLQQSRVRILGLIENMSYFDCPTCHTETAIFDRGGGATTSEREGVPFLGEIPLDPKIRASGDAGIPVTIAEPDSPQAQAFRKLADQLWAALVPT